MATWLRNMWVIYKGATYQNGDTVNIDTSDRDIVVRYELKADENPKLGTVQIRFGDETVWSYYYSYIRPNADYTHTVSFTLTDEQINELKRNPYIRVLFIDTSGNIRSNLYVRVNVVEHTGYNQSGTCSKQYYRDTMVNNYRKSPLLVGWDNQYSPILNVTNTVKQVEPNVQSALLTIYGDNLNRIIVDGPYNYEPNPLPTSEVVNNWEHGIEWERMHCPYDGKWYWVGFPCRLEKHYNNQSNPSEPQPQPRPNPEPKPITPPTQNSIANTLTMTIKLIKKPLIRGVLVEVRGDNLTKSYIFRQVGQTVRLNVESGKDYTIYAKKRFELIPSFVVFTAERGKKEYIKGRGFEVEIEVM